MYCRLDISNDLMSPHIGDLILEVNGVLINSQPLHEIEDMICKSENVQVSPIQIEYRRGF